MMLRGSGPQKALFVATSLVALRLAPCCHSFHLQPRPLQWSAVCNLETVHPPRRAKAARPHALRTDTATDLDGPCIEALSRQGFLTAALTGLLIGSAGAVLSPASAAVDAAVVGDDIIATGIVDLADGVDLSRVSTEDRTTLFVTVRAGGRGPVIASTSYVKPTLPMVVEVRTSQIYAPTPEKQSKVAKAISKQDVVVSARLDKDGVASTRDPEDLVGQGVVYKFNTDVFAQWSRADIRLKGRGAFGEFVTKKGKR